MLFTILLRYLQQIYDSKPFETSTRHHAGCITDAHIKFVVV